jgi:hypothetical protein
MKRKDSPHGAVVSLSPKSGKGRPTVFIVELNTTTGKLCETFATYEAARRRVDSLSAECLVGMPLIFEELPDDSQRLVREDGKPLQWHRLPVDQPPIPEQPLPLSEELPGLSKGGWVPLTRAETPEDGWDEP